MSGSMPLLADGPGLDTPLAWRGGQPLSRRRYLQDVAALAATLPAGGPVLAMTGDRYRFALALGAALVRGQAGLILERLLPVRYRLAPHWTGRPAHKPTKAWRAQW